MADNWNAAHPRHVVVVNEAGEPVGDGVMTNSGAPTKVTVTTDSTEIIPADPTRDYSINFVIYSGGPVFLHEDGAATVDDFPAATGATGEYASTRALNGIVASGTADVRTWPNGGAA